MTSVAPEREQKIYGGPSYSNPKEWIPLDFPHTRGTTSPGRQVAARWPSSEQRGLARTRCLSAFGAQALYRRAVTPRPASATSPWEALWGDEQVYVIEGTVTVTDRATGEVYKYKPGDIFSISKNNDTDWHVDGPYFKKYFCIAHNEPVDLDTASIPLQSFG